MKYFSTTVYKIGVNPYILLPPGVLSELFKQAGKDKGPIPVRGAMNGHEFDQTLVKYSGLYLEAIETVFKR